MKRLAVIIGLALVGLMLVSLARTWSVRPQQPSVIDGSGTRFDPAKVATHLAGTLRFATVSAKTAERLPFEELRQYLRQNYPQIHSHSSEYTVGQASILEWQGSTPTLNPVLFYFHSDVVPASDGDWSHPPFSGTIDKDYVWGRGALDDKGGLIAFLEAAERLAGEGYQPRRSIFLVVGEDEELGGRQGAARVAAQLRQRRVHLAALFDEGGFITEGLIDGVEKPVALVGIAEKGYLTLQLRVETAGGHSSLPPLETAPGILSAAILKVQNCQLAGGFHGPAESMLRTLAPHMSFPVRLGVANAWLTLPFLERGIRSVATTRALFFTTAAPTVLRAGERDNVLAANAEALVNLRLIPGDNPQGASRRIEECIADRRVKVSNHSGNTTIGPSPISPMDSLAYRTLAGTIAANYPDTLISPWVTVGATDSRHFADLTDAILRFLPLRLSKPDLARIHGHNERVAVTDLADAATFYYRLIQNLNL